LLLVILFNLAGNGYWIRTNQVIIGHDASGYLERSLAVANVLTQLTPQTFFQALTYHHYRPPLLYLASQPFYALLGPSFDSAQWGIVAWLVGIVLLTFAYGRALANDVVGLLAAALVGLLPMIMAMTRLYYTENLLTALVLLNLWALLHSAGFTRRGWALLWGVSLGLGLLVKWTFPIYVLLSALLVFVQVFGPRPQWRMLRPWPLVGGTLGRAGVLALVVAGLWYLPNRTQIAPLLLGHWLLLCWAILLLPFCYAWQRPTTPATNLVMGLFAGLVIASLWYLPRLEFVTQLWDVALGTDRGHYEAANPFRLANYGRYPRYLVFYDLGLLAALLILPFGFGPWLRRFWLALRQPVYTTANTANVAQRPQSFFSLHLAELVDFQRGPLSAARPAAWILWSSVVLTYVMLSLTSQDSERNLAPLLPVLILLCCDGLRAYPRKLAMGLALLWLGVLTVQYGLYTLDALTPLRLQTAPLWASSEFLVPPASDVTDLGYWIAPDVIATVDVPTGPASSLGVLVNSSNIHRSPLDYLIAQQKRNIVTKTLEADEETNWGALYACQWVLLKDGDNHDVGPTGQAMIQRVLAGDSLFTQLYQMRKRYALPNGETAFLYQRTAGPAYPYANPAMLAAAKPLVEAIQRWRTAQTPLLIANADLAVWLGLNRLEATPLFVLNPETTTPTLAAQSAATLFVVLDNNAQTLQKWLDKHAVKAAEIGNDQIALAIYGLAQQALVDLPGDARWPALAVTQIQSQVQLQPGAVLPVQLAMTGQTSGALKASIRLLDPSGQVVAQNDVAVTAQIHLGLFLPPAAPPGAYTLAMVLYDPADLKPIADNHGTSVVPLTTIKVTNY
jgi:4-amino-4-deoxy-L-arabinose transferase-like glycosyltransferase